MRFVETTDVESGNEEEPFVERSDVEGAKEEAATNTDKSNKEAERFVEGRI